MLRVIQQLVERVPRQEPAVTQLCGVVLFKQLVQVGRKLPMAIILSQTQRIAEPLLIHLRHNNSACLTLGSTFVPCKKTLEHQFLQNTSGLLFISLKPKRASETLARASSRPNLTCSAPPLLRLSVMRCSTCCS
ncbi:hypothetical protein FQZ97_775880 [compost metagenome]